MYRWPVALHTPSDLAATQSGQSPATGWLEVPARGAAYTLSRLSRIGHPIQLSLIDAFLRGQVPVTVTDGLGADSRSLVANLLGPMAWLHCRGIVEASINELTLRTQGTFGSSFVFATGATEETVVCIATGASRESGGYRVPDPNQVSVSGRHPWLVEVGLPTAAELGDTRLARIRTRIHPPPLTRRDPPEHPPPSGLVPVDVYGGRFEDDVVLESMSGAETFDPQRHLERAWNVAEELIGRSLIERRTEPIALVLNSTARSTRLSIGWSLALPRNQKVFAAWLGTDGQARFRMSRGRAPEPTD